ncbi:hypothetical protein [Stenotrophomonas sp. MMGLT7]|uniref:hypothetical protein n=1 Tax=Stenotrophomonas sp. MMGLT7 TaxID=2901227 RepID=UPI001E310B27|nr:hypothetical protein [Stenotrophomonas sp. MMGLT7]MCD7099081.1 hypothetical protein [Stenotrophomonas sp. MMGLT7]
MSSTVADLNRSAQASIAQVLADGALLDSATLIDRVMALGYRHRPYVAGIVSKAFLVGMIERVGLGRPYRYRLAPGWAGDLAAPASQRSAPRERVLNEPRTRDMTQATAYAGPAFDLGPLVPDLGTVCESQEEREGELPPMVGARLRDSLDAQFARMFGEDWRP